MSAVLAPNYFTAGLSLAGGVSVRIEAPSLAAVAAIVQRLDPAANDTSAPTAAGFFIGSAVTQAPASAPTAAPAANKTGTPKPTAAPAATPAPAPASAPAVASGSDAAAEKRPTYDDVKERVLAVLKTTDGRAKVPTLLAQFNVDHATKLGLEQYPAFIVAADQLLGVAA